MSISGGQQETIRKCLALSLVEGVGTQTIRRLLGVFHDFDGIARAKLGDLQSVHGVGPSIARSLMGGWAYESADREIEYARRHGIRILCGLLGELPGRLQGCEDAPLVLFYRGDAPLPPDSAKWISIVGTRRATRYGLDFVRSFLTELREAGHEPVVVSGLAEGIDGEAHRVSLDLGLTTLGVLGHGMRTLYPAHHRDLAARMVHQGGLLTEYPSTVTGERSTFIQRNRIIAGLSDATIVAESRVRGGAMSTAKMAFEYKRSVFALPGSVHSETSEGCHSLIRRGRAALLARGNDLIEALEWDSPRTPSMTGALFYAPTDEEAQLLAAIPEGTPTHFDLIVRASRLPINRVNALLLQLELNGLIRQLHGRNYVRGR